MMAISTGGFIDEYESYSHFESVFIGYRYRIGTSALVRYEYCRSKLARGMDRIPFFGEESQNTEHSKKTEL